MAADKNPYAMITKGDAKPPKKIRRISHHMSHDGKIIHTHEHHHPEYHEDETHVSNNTDEAQKHLADSIPNMSATAPAMPSPDAAAGAAPAGGPAPGGAPAGM